jgi:anti-sigma B factor antagonist
MSDVAFPLDYLRGVPVVTASEEIDATNANGLRSALLEAAAHGHATFVVNLTRTRFCDSAGLNVLVLGHKRALSEGGELRLVIPSVPVLRAFAIAGVDRVIPHFATLDEALAQTPAVTIRLRYRPPSPGQRILAGLLLPETAGPHAQRTLRVRHVRRIQRAPGTQASAG